MSMGAATTADELLAEVVAIGPAARGVGGNDAEDATGTVATGDVAPSAARTGWLPAVADVAVGGVVAETGAPEVLLGAVVDPAEAPGVVAAGGVLVTAEVAEFVEVVAVAVVAAAEAIEVFEAGAVVATVDAPGLVVVVAVGVPVEAVVDVVEAPGVVAEVVAGATAPVAAIAELAAASIVAEVVGSPVVAAGEGVRATGAAVVPDDKAEVVPVGNGVGADAADDATGDVTVEEVVGVETPVVVEDVPVDVVEGPVVVEDVPADAVEAPIVVEDIPADEVNAVEAPVGVDDVATEEVVGVDGLAGETVEAPAAGAVAARGPTPEVRGDVRSDRGPGASVSRAVALGVAEVEAPAALMPNPVVAAGTLARSTRPTAASGFATAAGIGAEAA